MTDPVPADLTASPRPGASCREGFGGFWVSGPGFGFGFLLFAFRVKLVQERFVLIHEV